MERAGIQIQRLLAPPTSRREFEHVERKGLGHPDSICDAVMEAISLALCKEYLDRFGRVLHHNLDKGMLVAGQTSPAPGGGTVDAPMRLIFGDRATLECGGVRVPVGEIAEATARRWFSERLRFVDPVRHLVFQNELRPGSPELVDIFGREELSANDTSAGVGFAPLTETERLVLAAERRLNSPEFRQRFPEAGEDVKVMAVRRGRALRLTVAVAFVDRFVAGERVYFDRKAEIREDLARFLETGLRELDGVAVDLNVLDDPRRGLGGMYLTVLGTSAEGADSGQVGRGNRANGLITLHRPMSMEAVAGKNPVSHVGKIYNVLSHRIADRICTSIEAIEESTVWLVSQIGRPLSDPWSVAVNVVLGDGANLADVEPTLQDVIEKELAGVHALVEQLVAGGIPAVV